MQLIECVPNFSEGADLYVIKQITDVIAAVSGVRLLNVDPGKGANRTVVTFAGSPGAVVEAAFLAIKKAAELVDMRRHHGEHPRIGATDVCPLIPVSDISLAETAVYARALGKRVGGELGIPVYLYEHAQDDKARSNLSVIRAGEYEGFFKKIKLPGWRPDFGPAEMDAKRGATVIGARDFLAAYNVNLNTPSVAVANAIAMEVRESGRVIQEVGPVSGKTVIDQEGRLKRQPGTLKYVKAIGWYIKEYGIAQVSMNLTNLAITPLHTAFVEVCSRAAEHGVQVTGSELIGMVPLKTLVDAGRYFLEKQGGRAAGEKELIQIAVKSLGLDDLGPFDAEKRIIEYQLQDQQGKGAEENL